MNLTKNSYPKPPTKNQLNHETEMKTRLKTLVLQAYRKPENACTVPKTYVRQKRRKNSHVKTYKKYVDKVMKRRKLNANNLPKI